ncbi:hypothetical protein ACFWOX_33870 [Streptomyces sp. NPDC058467]|uniref:hypothetical protein n=1 Tax=Streptomyces sp. NPDC058467 TaxID=3346513 RepID=UPI00366823CA
MTSEITAPIAGQRSAVQVLADLIGQHPELPAAFITVHEPWKGEPARLDLQLSAPTLFNPWRSVLDVDPARVVLHPSGRASWIEATTVREGIHIVISAHGILLTNDQLAAPRDTSEVSV